MSTPEPGDRIRSSPTNAPEDILALLEESVDGDDWNVYWDEFYDWADEARVWVATF